MTYISQPWTGTGRTCVLDWNSDFSFVLRGAGIRLALGGCLRAMSGKG